MRVQYTGTFHAAAVRRGRENGVGVASAGGVAITRRQRPRRSTWLCRAVSMLGRRASV